jgi:hypothetical protein
LLLIVWFMEQQQHHLESVGKTETRSLPYKFWGSISTVRWSWLFRAHFQGENGWFGTQYGTWSPSVSWLPLFSCRYDWPSHLSVHIPQPGCPLLWRIAAFWVFSQPPNTPALVQKNIRITKVLCGNQLGDAQRHWCVINSHELGHKSYEVVKS